MYRKYTDNKYYMLCITEAEKNFDVFKLYIIPTSNIELYL